jgi:hypothetical protein
MCIRDRLQLGISKLRDVVITALQDVLLATTSGDVERAEYIKSDFVWSMPFQAGIVMQFAIDRIGA